MISAYENISLSQLKSWARLTDAKFRRQENIFLAEGVKVVEELLASDWRVLALLVMPDKMKYWERLPMGAGSKFPVYQLSRSQWQKIGQDREPEGIMAVVQIKHPPLLSAAISRTAANLLILYKINNPRNLGALMRSAHWFGFTGIIISENSADYTNPKAVRASMGSLFHLTIVPEVDLSTTLPEIKKDFFIIGSDVRQGIKPHLVAKKAALLLGNESHGLPDVLLKMADEKWSIPGSGQADSLSLPQAAAIMMYECVKK
ncbi:MAG TPA: RNA methyltransferase [Deltaproteobacteria bacterium]|nr:RNA methyltransferase [Deltaproteobacteria bacterium]